MSKAQQDVFTTVEDSFQVEEFLAASFTDIAEALDAHGVSLRQISYRALSQHHSARARLLRAERALVADTGHLHTGG